MRPDVTSYEEFLAARRGRPLPRGIEAPGDILPAAMPHQRHGIAFALCRGRSALFFDTGLGKGLCALEWARIVARHTGLPSLILAPLAVARQFVREGAKFGIEARHVREAAEIGPGVNVANYERLDRFAGIEFGGVVLDESSILKAVDGKTRAALAARFATTPYRLCCTATPAPNDHTELGNHAEFLGIMQAQDMLQRWFINDTGTASQEWRLKGHAVADFWDWVCSWALCAGSPADLGYDASAYVLPELVEIVHRVEGDITADADGALFRLGGMSATTMHREQRRSLAERAAEIARLVASEPGEQWLLACETNDQADAVRAACPEAIEVRGSMPPDVKEERLTDFAEGRSRVLLSKPRIVGFGLNLQGCARIGVLAASFSFERYYQLVRRCWRFGQERPVHVHLLTSAGEEAVFEAVRRKAEAHAGMAAEMRAAVGRALGRDRAVRVGYEAGAVRALPGWAGGRKGTAMIACQDAASGANHALYRGDCVEVVRQMPDGCADFSVYSPPFPGLFVYSDSERDMGNTAGDDEFFAHYSFLVGELLRVTAPGRLTAVHCSDLPTTKWRDGAIGLRDFPGRIIAAHQAAGWVYHGRVTIWRSPVTEMTRTKALGLLYKQLRKDSSRSRPGLPDYLLIFAKPGENAKPIAHRPEEFPLDLWQEIASPVWMTVRQSRTLAVAQARDGKDERHLCPMQLDVIDRALALYTNPGDVVLSPFAGVGSEGVEAVLKGRRFVGVELKRSYFDRACRFLEEAEREAGTVDLFAGLRSAG